MHAAVIDANVFHAFYYETIHGHPHTERTASALPIFQSLGSKSVGFVDSGEIIENEWRQVCAGASEWFTAWLEDAIIHGHVYEVDASDDANLLKRYRAVGFPGGRDVCYIRVAHALTRVCKRTVPWIVAEDVDFFDPTKKSSGKKAETLKAGTGAVARQLRTDGIRVACIATFSRELIAE